MCRAVQDAEIASEEGEALLLQLLDVPMETVPVAQLSPQAQRTRTFALLRQLFLHTSQRQPLILAVENCHWLDATLEEWLTTLIARLSGTSILLLVTYRPGYRPPWLQQSLATQIALPRLVPQDSLTVVQSVAQSAPLPAHLAQAIVARAGGNFFLEELTWAVVESGNRSAVPSIPTLSRQCWQRLDRLPLAEKRPCRQRRSLAQTCPCPSCTPSLRELRRTSRAVSSTCKQRNSMRPALIPELTYTFKHVLTQEVAYNAGAGAAAGLA